MKISTDFFRKYIRRLYGILIEPLVSSKNSPHFDALGVSLGLFAGFLIPVGGQLAFLGLMRIFVKFNLIVGGAFTLVSNPLNMIPLYYGYYLMGSLILGKPEHLIEFSSFEMIMDPILNSGNSWESLNGFLDLGKVFLVRWLLAAVILSTVSGLFGYLITYRIQKRRIMAAAISMDREYHDLARKLKTKHEQS